MSDGGLGDCPTNKIGPEVVSMSVARYSGAYLRHRHWKALDRDIGIEWLENISRYQRFVDAGIFVLVELRKVALPYVDHFELKRVQESREEAGARQQGRDSD